MHRVKKYIISLSVMMIVAMVSLLIVSVFTYLFKWKSDKAMIGIIVTYVFAGFAGGICLRREKQMGHRRKLIESLIIGTAYILLLLLLSCFVFQIPFQFSIRFLMIWLLIVFTAFVAVSIKIHS